MDYYSYIIKYTHMHVCTNEDISSFQLLDCGFDLNKDT